MDILRIDSKTIPTEPPKRMTVFVVGNIEYIFCPIRMRAYKVASKPEEIVRQSLLFRLKESYGYSFDQMAVEVPILVGSSEAKKRADIVIYQDAKRGSVRLFVEVKQPNRRDGVEQLKVYMNATGCRLGLWSNGTPPHIYLLRIEPSESQEEATWRELRNIPAKNEKLSDVDTPITRGELEPVKDFLGLLKECEDYIKAHEGASPFDEIFKLIFAKLFDERTNLKNETSSAQFRVGALESPVEARDRILKLFDKAKERWAGVFKPHEEIGLTDESLAFCVSAMQKCYLLRSDSDILGAAFEVMINPEMKGDKGQYFTPRHVIKMCVDILDPKDHETVFDPACGSGGFLIGAMDHVYKKIENDRDDENEILENKKDYASECIFGIDYDHLIAKVAKAYMLIWGDGRSNIAVCDGLSEESWTPDIRAKFTNGGRGDLKTFDVIVTNPPFAGDLSTESTLSKYELAYKVGKAGARTRVNKMSRDRLFIERCIKLLNPGGRIAIVLPRGILKNYTDEPVRKYILKNTSVRAVIALGGDMFKPFTNTKTCILFAQKRKVSLTDQQLKTIDESVVFAVTEKPGKDRTGQIILKQTGEVDSDLESITAYVKKNVKFED